MNSQLTNKTDLVPETVIPFVNEECGDTMWDEVMKQKETINQKNKINESITN